MILAIDMGNTHIEVGILKGDEILVSERISTDIGKTDTEYAVLLHTILEICGIDGRDIEGGILSSVVPPLTHALKSAVRKVIGKAPLVVGPGVKNGLVIRIDDPKSLGADLVVGAVAGIRIYGAPLILIDMGTATTMSAIDEKGQFLGGPILPGAGTSVEALSNAASQLPKISLEAPDHVIGTNTIDSMRSGVLFGQAEMLDGMIDRMAHEMADTGKARSEEDIKVVATGGLARVVVPLMRHKITLDNELMIRGLGIIYKKNRRGHE